MLVFGIVLFSNVDGLLDYMCAEKGKANWEELWAGMVGASVNWFPDGRKEGSMFCVHVKGSQMSP